MNKKTLLGVGLVAIAASFWACGSGEVVSQGGDEDTALAMYGPGTDAMAPLVNGALSACEADEACKAKMEGSTYVPPSEDEEPAGEEPSGDQPSGETPVASSTSTAIDVPVTSSPSTPITTPVASSTSGTIIAPPTPSSTSTIITPPTPSSTSTVVTPTTPSSTSTTPQPTSSAAASSASQGGSTGGGCPTDGTPVVLNYSGEKTELSAGTYKLTSTNQWSGVLRCQANENVTVQVDCADASVTQSLNSIGNAKPTAQNPVIMVVPAGKSVSCHTDW